MVRKTQIVRTVRLKKMKKGKKRPPPWTPFAEMPPMVIGGIEDRIFVNHRYQVNATEYSNGHSSILHLSIKSKDKSPIHDWRHFQLIKNEVTTLYGWGNGEECEAMEIYPAESRLVDTANQYHLWVLPEGGRVPYGFMERNISEVEVSAPGPPSSRQRKWPKGMRPKDCETGQPPEEQ